MSPIELKKELHQLIENTSDTAMLEKMYAEFASGNADWWDELSEAQKLRLSEAEEQYKSGNVVSNEAVLKKIAQWLQK